MTDWCAELKNVAADYARTAADDYFNPSWYSKHFLREERASYKDIENHVETGVTYLVSQGKVITQKEIGRARVPTLMYSVTMPGEWFEDKSIGRIAERIRHLGLGLATEVNRAIVTVLVEAGTKKSADKYDALDTAIYEIEDEMCEGGLEPDLVLVNRQLKTPLLRHNIVTYDGAYETNHYIGRTKTWLRVYWANEVPLDSMIIFDGARSGVLLRPDRPYGAQYEAISRRGACDLTMSIRVNPIIDNRAAVARLSDISDLVRQLKMGYALKPMGKCLFSEEPCSRVINASNQCFVAVPSKGFGKLTNIIDQVLTEKEITPWIPTEHERPNKSILCTKICGPIIESRYCIAVMDIDPRYQASNPNVCWEYGIMTMLRKKVIPVAKQDSESDLPFDVKLLDFTLYKDEKSLRQKLRRAISALIAQPERRSGSVS